MRAQRQVASRNKGSEACFGVETRAHLEAIIEYKWRLRSTYVPMRLRGQFLITGEGSAAVFE
jgi:hypothetical protein